MTETYFQGHRRDQVEETLRARIDKFEAMMKGINRELEAFMKKDPPVLTMDEMKGSVVTIDRLQVRTEEANMVRNTILPQIKITGTIVYWNC